MSTQEHRSHRQHRSRPGLAASSRGVVLVIVLLLSAVITLTVLAFSLGVGTDLRISRNDLQGKQALAAAEAGVEHGIEALQKSVPVTGDNAAVSTFLTAELGMSPTGALGKLGSIAPRYEAGEDGDLRNYNYSCVTYGEGSYCLRLIDNHDEVAAGFPLNCVKTADDQTTDCDLAVTLRSRGEVGGAVRIVDVLLKLSPEPDCAIIANGNLSLGGSSSIEGSKGCVHGNGDLKLSGAMSATGQVTASSNLSVQNNSVEVGSVTLNNDALKRSYEAGASNQPKLPVPSVRPMQFGADAISLPTLVMNDSAGYRLDADGRIYTGAGWTCQEAGSDCTGGTALNAGAISAANLGNWSFVSGKWKLNGPVANGLYFSETGVMISSSVGSALAPWRATLIALDSIQVTGSPVISAYYQSTVPGNIIVNGYVTEASPGPWKLRDLLLVSGNDLDLRGTGVNAQYTGGLYAHQQVKTSGNFFLKGFMYVENGENGWTGEFKCNAGWDLQACGNIDIGGNFTISYDGLGTAANPPAVRKLSWSDVK